MAQEKFSEALSDFKKAESSCSSGETDRIFKFVYNQGLAHNGLEDFNSALSCFERATKMMPEDPDAWQQLILAYQCSERPDLEIFDKLETGLKACDNHPQLLVVRGQLIIQVSPSHRQRGLEDLNVAFDSYDLGTIKGRKYAAQVVDILLACDGVSRVGSDDLAQEVFQKSYGVPSLSPRFVDDVLYTLKILNKLSEDRRFEKVLEVTQRFLGEYPRQKNTEHNVLLALVAWCRVSAYTGLNDMGNAKEEYEKVEALDSKNSNVLQFARTYKKSGDPGSPEFFKAGGGWFKEGSRLMRLAEHSADEERRCFIVLAEECFSQVLASNPCEAASLFGRARARNFLQNMDGAIEDCDQFLRINTDKIFQQKALYVRGVSCFSLGRADEGVRNFDEAITIDPESEEAKKIEAFLSELPPSLRRSF